MPRTCPTTAGYQQSRLLWEDGISMGEDLFMLLLGSTGDGIYQAFNNGERAHVEDEVIPPTDGWSFATAYYSYHATKGSELVSCAVMS